MSALITGATGFIGFNLVSRLCEQGGRVRCLVRPMSRTEPLRTLSCQVVTGHLDRPESLEKALDGMEVIYHLAGATKAKNLSEFRRANVENTRSLFDAVLKYAPHVKRVVHVSSIAAAGPSSDGRPLNESDQSGPISDYGRSKLEGEKVALSYGDRLPVVVLRPPVVYGPRDRDVFQFIKVVSRFRLRPGIGFSPRSVSVVEVSDLVRAMIRCSAHEAAKGKTYYVTSGPPHVWSEMTRVIAKSAGVSSIGLPIPQPFVRIAGIVGGIVGRISGGLPALNSDKSIEMCAKHWVCDSTRIEQDLGFRPSVDLESGMRSAIEWYRRHDWL